MEKAIHPNYFKASNLVMISAAVGMINIFFFSPEVGVTEKVVAVVILFIVMRLIAYFIRKGNKSVKYILLVLLILGTLLSIPYLLIAFKASPVAGVLNIIQTGLQIWSVVLLFQVPKNSAEFDENDYAQPDMDSN